MTKLFIHNLVDKKYFSKIKQINHEGKIYYELIIDNNFDKYDKVYFETNPHLCNKCNIFFNTYKRIYINYLYILKKNLNESIFSKIIYKLKKYKHIKCEHDFIGTYTFWYIHLCYKCYK